MFGQAPKGLDLYGFGRRADRVRRGEGFVLIHQLNRQRVDLRLHEVPKGLVDPAVGLQSPQSVQRRGGDADAEMAAAVAGARMATMKMALVDDLAGRGLERDLQTLANQRDAIGTHGST